LIQAIAYEVKEGKYDCDINDSNLLIEKLKKRMSQLKGGNKFLNDRMAAM